MDKQLERVETKVDSVVESISNINVHVAEIKKDLKYHIKRTDILEAELKPIKRHVALMQATFKLLGMSVSLAVIVEAVVSLLEYAKHK